MTQQGLEIALSYGEQLPSFDSISAAKAFYFQYRDRHLDLLAEISKGHTQFNMDYSTKSLKSLEKWYFDLFENDSFQNYGLDRPTFEVCLAMYFCEVVVRNSSDAKWIVSEFAFIGGKYELGVKKGLMSYMLSRCTDHFKESNNRRKQLLYRTYKHYFGQI